MILYIGLMTAILLAGLIRVRFVYGYSTTNLSPSVGRRVSDNGKQGKRKFLTFFFVMVFFVLAALKGPYIGNDTPAYIEMFAKEQQWAATYRTEFLANLFVSESRFELGYVVLSRLIALLFGDVQWLFIVITGFVAIVLYNWIIEESLNPVISLFMFVSLRFLYFIMSGLRQSVAVFVCVLAYRYIKKRKLIPFVLLVLLATQFHITAILFLLAYPLSYLRFNKTTVVGISVVGIIVVLLFNQVLNMFVQLLPTYYGDYVGSEKFAENKLGNVVAALVQFVFLYASSLSRYRISGKTKSNEMFTREYDEASFMQFMMLMSFLLSVIAIRATTLDRLSMYFWIFSIIYIPNMLCNIHKRENRMLLQAGAVVLTFLYNVIILYYRPEWHGIMPYKFFWQ